MTIGTVPNIYRTKLRKNMNRNHRNGDKTDNAPSNLMLADGNARHFLEHRSKNCNLKKPNEPNLMVECACGCGGTFRKYDAVGRPRKYISGHNTSERNRNVKVVG